MAIRLYTMRLRQGMKGVVAGFIEVPAGDPAVERAHAEKMGKLYCDAEPGRRFIGVEPAVLVRYEPTAETPTGAPDPAAGAPGARRGKAS